MDMDFLLMHLNFLQERWQRVKINITFSLWTQLLQRVPQGSVLGPMVLNIYINIFFALNEIDICNFADDPAPYVCDSNLKSVLGKLEHNSELAQRRMQDFRKVSQEF